MILATDVSINIQVGDLNNQGMFDYWNSHKFRVTDFFCNKINIYHIFSMLFIMILTKLIMSLFFGQLCIGVNIP